MNDKAFLKQTRQLLDSVEYAIEEGNTPLEECNSFIDELDELKDALVDDDKFWVNSYPDINKLGGFFSPEVSKDEINDVLVKVQNQLNKIFRRLGGNLNDANKRNKQNGSPMVQVIQSQNQAQFQNQTQNQTIKIELLEKELEEELSKSNPDTSRIKRVINDLINVAKLSAPTIITQIIMKKLGF